MLSFSIDLRKKITITGRVILEWEAEEVLWRGVGCYQNGSGQQIGPSLAVSGGQDPEIPKATQAPTHKIAYRMKDRLPGLWWIAGVIDELNSHDTFTDRCTPKVACDNCHD